MPISVVAYPVPWRTAAALLVVASRLGALALAMLVLFLDAWLGSPLRLQNPLRLLRAFTVITLLPALVAWLIERACVATVTAAPQALVLERRRQRIEIPSAAVDRVLPWRVPLPAGGLSLRLRSGRRLRYGLQMAVSAAVEVLVSAGAPGSLREAAERPAARYADSLPGSRRPWYHPLLKFAVFALVPTLPLFRLHQWIAYGGTFGEYYLYGLAPYLLGFGVYWATLAVFLVLYAAGLRALGEPIVLIAAHLAPGRTATVRRAVEVGHGVLYYGGVPLILLWRLLVS